jgi:putative two-component system response regulator
MHDIGKIGIPDSILQKPGKLTQEEWAIMREHPVIGARIIGVHTVGLLHMAHDIALTHHERWDGSGYPRGLQGEEIPVVGRIVAVADVFDALTTQRPYKKAWPLNEAIAYIREQRGKHFDPRLVEVFLEQLPAVLEVKERWAEKI